MTEEKQCAGFNTGSESGLRSCVVGGPLSTERGTIATASRRAAGAASLLGFTVSWSWRHRWLLWERDRLDKDARTPKSVGYAFFKIHARPYSFSLSSFSVWTRTEIGISRVYREIFEPPVAIVGCVSRLMHRHGRDRLHTGITNVREALRG